MSGKVKQEYEQIAKDRDEMVAFLQKTLESRNDELADLNDRYIGLQVNLFYVFRFTCLDAGKLYLSILLCLLPAGKLILYTCALFFLLYHVCEALL